MQRRTPESESRWRLRRRRSAQDPPRQGPLRRVKARRPRDAGLRSPSSSRSEARASYLSALHTRDIFRQLIADEIRTGRLTPARRRRVVQYAASMGLSAVEAGQLISACRKELLTSEDPAERHRALELVEPPPERWPIALKLSIVVGLAILLDLLLLKWLW